MDTSDISMPEEEEDELRIIPNNNLISTSSGPEATLRYCGSRYNLCKNTKPLFI